MTKPNSREPTAEQMVTWYNATLGLSFQKAVKVATALAYQEGQAAALEKLRAGGVGLPETTLPIGEERGEFTFTENHYMEYKLLDYGDRRAAAVERVPCATETLAAAALQARLNEREACTQICEKNDADFGQGSDPWDGMKRCATAIRNRKETT